MKRVVFIVEGQTEQVFLQKLIEQLVSVQPYHLVLKKLHGRVIVTLSNRGANEADATHSIWIIDAAGDENVLSFIEDNLEDFKAKGFGAIFGLRDRYSGNKNKPPVNPAAIDQRTRFLRSVHQNMLIEVTVAIEEIEAWFLSVPDFFEKYHPSLTVQHVSEKVGFDIQTTNVESIAHPAALISQVLASVGLSYRKRLGESYKLTHRLDYQTLYLEKTAEIPALGRFVDQVSWALT